MSSPGDNFVERWYGETLEPADYERPVPPPCVRETAPTPRTVAEAGTETTIHLAQVAVPTLVKSYTGHALAEGGWRIEVWCSGKGPVAFDPRVANCARCLRAMHEAVST